MRSFLKYFSTLLFIVSPIVLFGDSNFNISPQYTYSIYDSQLRFSDSHGYGINFQYKFTKFFSSSAAFSLSNTRQSYDTIGGQSYFNLNASTYKIRFIITPLKIYNTVSINFATGLGAITLKSNRIKIDLGALGYRFIDAKSSSHILYSVGLPIEADIFSGIKLFVNPEVTFFNLDSELSKNYNLGGGLKFELF